MQFSARRPWAPTAARASALMAAAGWTALLALRVGGPDTTQAISNLGLASMALIGGAGCLWAAAHQVGRQRRAWSLLSMSAVSWGIGQLIWTFYESVLGRDLPFPSLADVGYLGAVPLAAAAMLSLPMGTATLAGRIRTVVDGLMIASSLLLISWISVLGPVFHHAEGSLLSQVISIAYPVGDVVVVTIALLLLLKHRRVGTHRLSPIALVCMAMVAIAVADSGFTYLTLTETYSSGSFIDIFWFAGYLLLFLASTRREARIDPTPGAMSEEVGLSLVLPYGAVLGAVGASVLQVVVSGGSDVFVSWNRSFIMALLVLRQVLALLENRSLTRHLEARVASRTAELAASQQRFEALVQHRSDVVNVVDAEGVVIYQSESSERVLGYPSSSLVGRRIDEVFDDASGALLDEGLAQAAIEPYRSLVLELTVRHGTGRSCGVETTITNLLDNEAVRGLVLNTRDVSERKRLQEELTHQAFHDSLTTLANRALFTDRVHHALDRVAHRGPTVAVLFVDLDGFKEINDSLGHATGDLLLVQVAQRLRSCTRPGDTVARLGGDEFAVLLEDANTDAAAMSVAQRMTTALQAPFLLEGREITIKGSFGIARAGLEAMDAHQLLRNADLAMYRAKADRQGGFVCYDPDMHAELVGRLEMEADLRRAVELGQLRVHFQPTVSLSTQRPLGFEALVRWHHPRHGLIPPDQFIPLAEATGAIRDIGRWVLGEACRQAAAWRLDHGELDELGMSVNISGRQLQHGDLAAEVAEALEASGLPPHCLVLEITETVLMEDSASSRSMLARIKELGVQLAIDDFGTGYSSLSYLQQFPVDVLKIDRSFIRDLVGGGGDSELVRTILDLARSLQLRTVAEGIESTAQLEALVELGCEYGQGFLMAAPAPADEVELLLRRVQQSRIP